MTSEDFQAKSPQVLREELNELIKEAKSKIKPVLMSEYDRAKYLKDWDEVKEDKSLFPIEAMGHSLLEKENISLEVLRKIQDKKLEIDIEYEQTRDLYEKQRVVDEYLQQHWEDDQLLNKYYENGYAGAELNKFAKHVYTNTYDLSTVRFHFLTATASTTVLTAALAAINPYLAALTLYDWFLLTGFSSKILSRMVFNMVLCENKQ